VTDVTDTDIAKGLDITQEEPPESALDVSRDTDIRLYGQPVLRKCALEVTEIDGPLVGLCHRMMIAMRRVSGLGVAAPQLGTGRRVFVWGEGQVAINPVLVEKDGEQVGAESCLSLPGVTLQVRRAQRVLMAAIDIDGKPYEREAEDLEARLFQHEVDHLDGVLTLDRITVRQQKRDAFRRLAKQGLVA
jgi:peptide deformylase